MLDNPEIEVVSRPAACIRKYKIEDYIDYVCDTQNGRLMIPNKRIGYDDFVDDNGRNMISIYLLSPFAGREKIVIGVAEVIGRSSDGTKRLYRANGGYYDRLYVLVRRLLNDYIKELTAQA